MEGGKPPARNRYFYGKMLDAYHLELEQSYQNQKRWLLNRLTVGTGTLCGLEVVPTPDGRGVQVEPGVAVDGAGREIIVNHLSAAVDPTHPTDDCGRATDKPLTGGGIVTLYLCYHECPSEPAPVLVDECGVKETCEYGIVEERYRLQIRAGLPSDPPGELPPELCHRLFGYSPKKSMQRLDTARVEVRAGREAEFMGAMNELRARRGADAVDAEMVAADDAREKMLQAERDFWLSAGSRRGLLCHFWGLRCPRPEDPCVPLAVIALDERGHVRRIDSCGPRNAIYSNSQLLDLILCLADRVDECCQEPVVMSLAKVAGDNQQGVAGQLLNGPLVARVTRGGTAVANEDVIFEALGDGQIGADPATLGTTFVATSNAQGEARLPAWQLGAGQGSHATLARIASGAPDQVFFKANATVVATLPVVQAVWPPNAARLSRAGNSEWFQRFVKERRFDVTFDRAMNVGHLDAPDPWLGIFLAAPVLGDMAVVMRLPVRHVPSPVAGILGAAGVTEVYRMLDATADGKLVHLKMAAGLRGAAGVDAAGARGDRNPRAAGGGVGGLGGAAVADLAGLQPIAQPLLGDAGYVRILESTGRVELLRREGFLRVVTEPDTPVPASFRLITLMRASGGNILDAQAPNRLLDADFAGGLLKPAVIKKLWALDPGDTGQFTPAEVWDGLVDTGNTLPKSGDGVEGGSFQSWFDLAMGDG